jgi:hypothetical protein
MSCSTSLNQVTKSSTEVLIVSMDFTEWLDTGITILTATINISPDTVTSSGVSIEGSIVYFTISGGVDGTNYTVEVTITTSDNQTLVGEGPLKIRDR